MDPLRLPFKHHMGGMAYRHSPGCEAALPFAGVLCMTGLWAWQGAGADKDGG